MVVASLLILPPIVRPDTSVVRKGVKVHGLGMEPIAVARCPKFEAHSAYKNTSYTGASSGEELRRRLVPSKT
eukprot:2147306-Prymnesium_polylepis.2